MIRPLMLGAIAAVVVAVPWRIAQFLERAFPNVSLRAPVLLLGVTVLAMLLQRFVLDRKPGPRGYQGLADFFLHIHGFGPLDTALRWFVRGFNSLLLSIFGGVVGPEGAAAEIAHAIGIESRDRSSRFSEQRRRIDASCALAGAVSAAFGAPFAAVLVPIELGLGGPAIRPVAAAIGGFLLSRGLGGPAANGFPGLREIVGAAQLSWLTGVGVLAIALILAPIGLLFVRSTAGIGGLLRELFQRQPWMRILMVGVLLTCLALIFPAGHQQPWKIFEQLLWGGFSGTSLGLLLVVETVTLALVLAGFGSVGVFWPLFVLGATLGVAMNQWIFHGLPGFAALAGVAGAGAAWGAILGTPLAAGVLAYELTQSGTALLIAIASALIARAAFKFIGVPGMITNDLKSRGMVLVDGRSFDVLDAISVREAMVVDFETVQEQEPVSELHMRLLKSRYPFIPVVSVQGLFRGLLTVDMIQEAWESQQRLGQVPHYNEGNEGKGQSEAQKFSQEITNDVSREMMMRLLEAKDLLYRTGLKFPTVKLADRLSAISGKFDESPCVAVVTEEGKVAGLLFVHHVRLAYDRELARRALLSGGGKIE